MSNRNKNEKTLKSLGELGQEFDFGKDLLGDLLNNEYINKSHDKKVIEAKEVNEIIEEVIEKENNNKEEIVKVEKEVVKEIIEEEISKNITLVQLKEELDITQKKSFGGNKNYFDKRIDFVIQKIDNVDRKLDLLLEVNSIGVNKVQKENEIKNMISKLSKMLGE